jgi:hypothetical protein
MSSDSTLLERGQTWTFWRQETSWLELERDVCFVRRGKKVLTTNQTSNFGTCYAKGIIRCIIICVWELSWAADSYSFGQKSIDSMEPWYSLPCVTKPCRSICPNSEECSLYLRISLKINIIIIIVLPTRLMCLNLHLPKFVYRFLLSPLLMLSLTFSLFLFQSHLKYL